MDDKEFRKQLEEAIKDNNLAEVQNLFEHHKPDGFDINFDDKSSYHRNTPLMNCILHGADLEVFQYLESQGAKASLSVSAHDNRVDGQRLPFGRDKDNEISITVPNGRYEKDLADPDVQDKMKKSQKILEYIDQNTNTAEKNEMGLLHLGIYYYDKELVSKLLSDPQIDVNKKGGGRDADPIRMAVFGGVRSEFADAVLERADLRVSHDIPVEVASFGTFKQFKDSLDKVAPEQMEEALLTTLKVGVALSEEHMDCIISKSPKLVASFLAEEQYEPYRFALDGAGKLDLLKQRYEKHQQLNAAISEISEEFILSIGNKKISEQKVEQYKHKVIDTMVKFGELSKDEAELIKKSDLLKENSKELATKLNDAGSKLSIKERVFMHLADFTKKIGFKSLSDYLVESALPKKADLKQAVFESINIGEKVKHSLSKKSEQQSHEKAEKAPPKKEKGSAGRGV